MVQQKKNATIRYFGDYVLMGEIAEGGMGVVFDARQISLNRRVALKLIRSGARASEGRARAFEWKRKPRPGSTIRGSFPSTKSENTTGRPSSR